jgi:hypothetical protein
MEDEMGGTCSKHEGEECMQGFDGESRRKETTMKTLTKVVGEG